MGASVYDARKAQCVQRDILSLEACREVIPPPYGTSAICEHLNILIALELQWDRHGAVRHDAAFSMSIHV